MPCCQEEEITLEPGRRRDVDDPFVISRGWLCNDLLQGQTREYMQFRLYLDGERLEDAARKVPLHKMWGLDVTEDTVKLFIRGDETSPVLRGELGGKVIPDESWMEFTSDMREVEGYPEPIEVPVLDVTLSKAPGAMIEWKDPLRLEDNFMNDDAAITGGEGYEETPFYPQTFRLRDFPMDPPKGQHRGVHWLQFTHSVQLWCPLYGDEWEGIKNEDFEVKVKPTGLSIKRIAGQDSVEILGCKLKQEVIPAESWYDLEVDLRGENGQGNSLVIELTKKVTGKQWKDGIFVETEFSEKDKNEPSWVALKPGRRKDVDDPFVASRSFLCAEFDQGQTETFITFRLILDQKKLGEAIEKVHYSKLWGLDITEKSMRLFIRGDEPSPVLFGELEGYCIPAMSTFELTKVTREVEGHKIAGTMETLPCLDVTIYKAPDSMYEWEEPLRTPDNMDQVQGSLEEYEQEKLKATPEAEPDREDWTPDDWADEQKNLASLLALLEAHCCWPC